MANIFTLENVEDFSERLNIDDLYEKKRNMDLTKLELFNKILNRIHIKIKTVSRQKVNEQFSWFLVPEIIIGVPRYDQAACIAYLIDKLKTNGFIVRYIHPNLLFISWMHWVPSYVRNELKKKTGIMINEYGVKVQETESDDKSIISQNDIQNNNLNVTKSAVISNKNKSKKEYTPIESYKPSGNLLYDNDVLSRINGKII
jgi:hypothetical protein